MQAKYDDEATRVSVLETKVATCQQARRDAERKQTELPPGLDARPSDRRSVTPVVTEHTEGLMEQTSLPDPGSSRKRGRV